MLNHIIDRNFGSCLFQLFVSSGSVGLARPIRWQTAIIVNVISSDTGIASHKPGIPIISGRIMNPGTIKMIPLSNMYMVERIARSQLW